MAQQHSRPRPHVSQCPRPRRAHPSMNKPMAAIQLPATRHGNPCPLLAERHHTCGYERYQRNERREGPGGPNSLAIRRDEPGQTPNRKVAQNPGHQRALALVPEGSGEIVEGALAAVAPGAVCIPSR